MNRLPGVQRLPAGDAATGVGMVDAFQAAHLRGADSWTAPNTVSNIRGRFGMTLNFATDFDTSGWGKKMWRAHIPGTANQRLRVVIAWDGTATCSSSTSCTGSVLDADLDLHVWKTSSDAFTRPPGMPTCSSSSWDSSYEVCDIPVIGGEDYLIAPSIGTKNAGATYFGIAWYTYPG